MILFYVLFLLIFTHGLMLHIKGFSYGEWLRRMLTPVKVRSLSVMTIMWGILMLIYAHDMNIPFILYLFGALSIVKGLIGLLAPYDNIYRLIIWWVDTLKTYHRTQGIFAIGMSLLFLLAIYR